MTYRAFRRWCNDRAHDGRLGLLEALTCCNIIGELQDLPFWKREKKWRECEQEVVTEIVEPTNAKIRELLDARRNSERDI